MTVPNNIPETPIAHREHEPFQGSKGKKISIPMEGFQHVLKPIMNIQDDEMWNPSFSGCLSEVLQT